MQRFLAIIFTTIVIGIYLLISTPVTKEDRVIFIKKGADISTTLDQAGVKSIFSNSLLSKYGKLFLFLTSKKVRFGEYKIAANSDINDVLRKISSNQVEYHKISFPEGITVSDALQKIKGNSFITYNDPVSIPTEGTMMPETYSVTYGYDSRDLIKTMIEGMKDFISIEWEKRDPDLPYKNPYEAIIMASIIEKEVGSSKCQLDEYKNISSVFVNRVKKNMRLQSSPTVFYGTNNNEHGKSNDSNSIKRDPTFEEIKIKHPYNTYVIKGLPPTAICNPGKKSIIAALHPAKTDYLFFVSDGNNCHTFSKDFDSHAKHASNYRAVKKIRKIVNSAH